MKFVSLVLILLAFLGLVGCSSSATKNADSVIDYDADTSYRESEEQLSESLEVPPNLLSPSRRNDDFDRVADAKISKDPEEGYRFIPTYRSDSAKVKTNFSERWLELAGLNSQAVWQGTQDFLVSMGFVIKESRKDIGFIRTEFLSRKELVPLDDQGPLTRLLNSWRPELAEGVYDRIIARVEYDQAKDVTRVYFYHAMVMNPSQVEQDELVANVTGDGWKIRPYNPMIEAEALYQAMIFFGATKSQAMAQVDTVVHQQSATDETVQEVSKIEFKASRQVAWDYLVSMIYRANWTVEQMRPEVFEAWIRVPDQPEKQGSITASLAFWSDERVETLPSVMKLSLEEKLVDGKLHSFLSVSEQEGSQPVTPEQRTFVFKSLGFLVEN